MTRVAFCVAAVVITFVVAVIVTKRERDAARVGMAVRANVYLALSAFLFACAGLVMAWSNR